MGFYLIVNPTRADKAGHGGALYNQTQAYAFIIVQKGVLSTLYHSLQIERWCKKPYKKLI